MEREIVNGKTWTTTEGGPLSEGMHHYRWTVTVRHGPLQKVDRYGKTWTITEGGPLR